MLTLPICCSCPICGVNYLRITKHPSISGEAGSAECAVANLELVDKARDYDVLVCIAVEISDDWSSVDAGGHLRRPFELYVLRARAFARFLVTAARLRQCVCGGHTRDIQDRLHLKVVVVLARDSL